MKSINRKGRKVKSKDRKELNYRVLTLRASRLNKITLAILSQTNSQWIKEKSNQYYRL